VEIHGFVDESLVNTVKANLDEEVEVALESFVLRSAAGRRSQRRYRLIEVAGQQSQLPPASELDDETQNPDCNSWTVKRPTAFTNQRIPRDADE